MRGFEVVAVETLALPLGEVVRDEGVENVLSEQFLQVVEEVEPLLVRNAGEGVVGIFALEIHDQLGEFVLLAKLVDRVRQCLPSDNGAEIAPGVVPMDGGLDASLEVGGPPLIEPEVLPAGVADEIPRPGVRQLVRDHVDVLAVVGNYRWSGEGENGVFHTAVREGRGQNEDIVLLPGIGVDNVFGRAEEEASVSADSSETQAESWSGDVATTLRGPIEEDTISPLASAKR